MLISI
jgi:hypothetical protein